MAESNTGETILAFLLGAIAGTVAGVLLAPEPGKQTRKRLQKWMDDQEEKSKDLLHSSKDIVQTGKETFSTQKEAMTEAYEAGKKAYRQATRS